jgi:hypothetical protein
MIVQWVLVQGGGLGKGYQGSFLGGTRNPSIAFTQSVGSKPYRIGVGRSGQGMRLTTHKVLQLKVQSSLSSMAWI